MILLINLHGSEIGLLATNLKRATMDTMEQTHNDTCECEPPLEYDFALLDKSRSYVIALVRWRLGDNGKPQCQFAVTTAEDFDQPPGVFEDPVDWIFRMEEQGRLMSLYDIVRKQHLLRVDDRRLETEDLPARTSWMALSPASSGPGLQQGVLYGLGPSDDVDRVRQDPSIVPLVPSITFGEVIDLLDDPTTVIVRSIGELDGDVLLSDERVNPEWSKPGNFIVWHATKIQEGIDSRGHDN